MCLALTHSTAPPLRADLTQLRSEVTVSPCVHAHMLPTPCITLRDTKRAYCCSKQLHSNASSHLSWQGPVGCHMAQVNSSCTAYSTEANHSIYSMCCHMWVSSSQLTATYKYWFCLLLVWYFCLVTPYMNKRSPLDNIMSLAEPYRRAQNVQLIQKWKSHTITAFVLVVYGGKRESISQQRT